MNTPFRTVIEPVPHSWNLSHSDSIITLGSCFSDEIGGKLTDYKFNCLTNPLGALYNPMSIHNLINLSVEKEICQDKILNRDNAFFHYDFHSSFFAMDKNSLVEKINNKLTEVSEKLKTAQYLIITWGTSWVYLKENKLVANCHKMPGNLFTKKILSPEEIIENFGALHELLKTFNPDLKIIITISPVRHIKDTLPLNNVSKSILRYATHEITNQFKNVHYYPSFELCIDDLRDYRFYKEDMIHPNNVAIEYIWNHFSSTFFNSKTSGINLEWEKIKKALEHRPFNEKSTSYFQFLNHIQKKIEDLESAIPLKAEKEEVLNRLKHFENEK